MTTITIVYTKSNWDLMSFLVRWALPRSRFRLAISSHCLIEMPDGEMISADLFSGVTKKPKEEAFKKRAVVKTVTYKVPNAEAGFEFLNKQVGKKYDIAGAFGLSMGPDRDWAEDDRWFCYELAASTLQASGLDVFENLSHVSEIPLLSLKT